jgi:diketogulonate reductase-like aldo/keto reductase
MRTLTLSSGAVMPVLGLGTWRMGESVSQRQTEIAALKQGLTLGMTLIDTAEMYGEGGAETVIAEAIANCRDAVFLVSKFYPHHATRQGVIAACDRSLQRLKTDYLDLYLLHWRSSVPLSETLEALQSLKTAGKIRDFGVSNFDTADMEEASALPQGNAIAVNQVLYNLSRRGIEWDLLPWCREHSIPIMAYSPIEQGRLLNNSTLKTIAQQRGVTPAQIAIAWLLHQENVIVIPKASSFEHLEQNRAALDIHWSLDELKQLDTAFPPPKKKVHLQIL